MLHSDLYMSTAFCATSNCLMLTDAVYHVSMEVLLSSSECECTEMHSALPHGMFCAMGQCAGRPMATWQADGGATERQSAAA